MTPIALALIAIGVVWIGYGSVWLLGNRSYRWAAPHHFLADLLGFPVEWAQSVWGRGGVPYALLMPNMLLFGTFTFLPLLLNFYVSFTGGSSISLFERPLVGTENYDRLFACESILDPKTCPAAGYNFWTGMFNTFRFAFVAVPVLCVVSLLTALVVDRVVRGRGFWRALFFYPVMLSPVVIANIWQWVLHRRGVLNAALGEAHAGVGSLATVAGVDILASVVVGIALLLTGERAWRGGNADVRRVAPDRAGGGQPSLPWAVLFVALVTLVLWWSDPLAMLGIGPGGADGAGDGAPLAAGGTAWRLALAFVLGAALLWQIADRRRHARLLIGVAGAVAMLALVAIQFDAVFDLGRFRPVNWLVTPNSGWPFFWLVFVYTWHHMGFYMLILLAGLQAIPRDLYEAAEMDAATPFRTFWRITFPLLMPTFTVVLVLSLIKAFQVFDEVYTLTGGGPGRETFMVVQYIFETAFSQSHIYGQAAAGSVVMAAVIAVLTLGQLWITRRQSGL